MFLMNRLVGKSAVALSIMLRPTALFAQTLVIVVDTVSALFRRGFVRAGA